MASLSQALERRKVREGELPLSLGAGTVPRGISESQPTRGAPERRQGLQRRQWRGALKAFVKIRKEGKI